jgi:hypothetical protein
VPIDVSVPSAAIVKDSTVSSFSSTASSQRCCGSTARNDGPPPLDAGASGVNARVSASTEYTAIWLL